MPVQIEFASGAYQAPRGLLFTDSLPVSAIHLVGVHEMEAELWVKATEWVSRSGRRRQGDGANPVLNIAHGAPPVFLQNLVLRGGVLVDTPQSTVEIAGCRFEAIQDVPALQIFNGSVAVERSSFLNCTAVTGPAISIWGGRLTVTGNQFHRNSASRNGGALHISGGFATLIECHFAENMAGDTGGAIFVAAGTVLLRDATLLLRNKAPSGRSLFVQDGKRIYQLPAPLGRWISSQGMPRETLHGEASISMDCVFALPSFSHLDPILDQLYATQCTHSAPFPAHLTDPYVCPSGFFGSNATTSAQSSPGCEGECWAGHRCPPSTAQPIGCGRGAYCPAGSGSETPCPGAHAQSHTAA